MFRTIFIFIAIIIIVILTMSYLQSHFTNNPEFTSVSDRDVVSIVVAKYKKMAMPGDPKLTVEIVSTAKSTTQGLSGRNEIGQDGMLFLFPDKAARNFWMKDMKFDIDIVWIDGDKIVGISEGVKKPEPDTEIIDLELVSVDAKTDKVLELNAGDVEKYGIQVGNVVILKK